MSLFARSRIRSLWPIARRPVIGWSVVVALLSLSIVGCASSNATVASRRLNQADAAPSQATWRRLGQFKLASNLSLTEASRRERFQPLVDAIQRRLEQQGFRVGTRSASYYGKGKAFDGDPPELERLTDVIFVDANETMSEAVRLEIARMLREDPAISTMAENVEFEPQYGQPWSDLDDFDVAQVPKTVFNPWFRQQEAVRPLGLGVPVEACFR